MPNPLLAQCADIVMTQGGIIPTLFLAGIAGSLSHCGPMCGPFVLGQLCQGETGPLWRRALVPYHAGRITTYGILGGLSGLFGAQVASLVPMQNIAAILLLAAASIFLFSALSRFLPKACAAPSWLRAAIDPLQSLRFFKRGYGLGLVLGLIPCGLLYAALLAAAATQNFAMGTLALVAFGLGTSPLLLTMAIGVGALPMGWRGRPWLGPTLATINSFLLFVIAGGLLS